MLIGTCVGWFPPKGDRESDIQEVVRAPEDTRPLAGKNSLNKALVTMNVLALEPKFCRITHVSQNGFVPGRNFINNLVDADAASRVYSLKYAGVFDEVSRFIKNTPVLSGNDFGAAFPSVIHQWIWLVLEHRKLPAPWIRFFQAIYSNAAAVTMSGGKLLVIISFLSGVLQGCPASALLFNLALDPFLVAFERALDFGKKGIVRACADDLVFALGLGLGLGLN